MHSLFKKRKLNWRLELFWFQYLILKNFQAQIVYFQMQDYIPFNHILTQQHLSFSNLLVKRNSSHLEEIIAR